MSIIYAYVYAHVDANIYVYVFFLQGRCLQYLKVERLNVHLVPVRFSMSFFLKGKMKLRSKHQFRLCTSKGDGRDWRS